MKNKDKNKDASPITNDVLSPLWISISTAAQFGGISSKTVRRAISEKKLRFKVISNRYLVDLRSLIRFLYTTKKLKNKLHENGLGQYINEWRE